MRFWRTDRSSIAQFIVENPALMVMHEVRRRPIVRKILFWPLERRDARPPRAVKLDDVSSYEIATHRLENLGVSPVEYIHVNPPSGSRHVPLSAAVEHIEAYASASEFLLVGYADGGLISVSPGLLPFQAGLQEAMWWRPHPEAQ